MSRILVFQHVAYELLGTLNPLLKRHGYRIKYVNFGRDPAARPRLDGYRGLVVLGGPMNVDQVESHPHLATEVELLREAVDVGMPVLGICLGAQLLAKALGAEVRPNPEKEIGWYDLSPTAEGARDPLFRHFDATERIFQWHGDTFDVPPGAVHLAESPGCRNQAFRFGENVYGLQFHLEVDEAMIERWLNVPAHLEEIQALDGRVEPDAIRRETPARIPRSKRLGDETFRAFIRHLGERRERSPLPHR